jgi:hypothetical protein
LEHLPHKQRAALVLRFYEDATEADIAAARTDRIESRRTGVPRPLLTLGAVAAALALVVSAVVFVGRNPEPTVVATEPTTTEAPTTEAPTTTTAPGPRCSASDLSPQGPDQPDLPPVVADMRRQIVEAAVSCDYERLAELTRQSPFFSFSFGAVDSEPATFRREAEEQGERPGGNGYLGYRVGITAEGDWIYFIAGD